MRQDRAATHFRAVDFAPDSLTVWAVGFEGRIMRSIDGGTTWERQKSGTIQRLYDIQALDGKHAFTCGSGGTVLATANGGALWYPLHTGTETRLVGVFFLNHSLGWAVGDDGLILATGDGGRTWEIRQSHVTTGLRRVWFRDERNGYAVGYHGVFLATADGGRTWTRRPAPGEMSIYGADFSPDGSTIHLTGAFGLIARSDDAGEHWRILPPVTTNFLRDITITSRGDGIAVGYGWILRRAGDHGEWAKAFRTPGINLQSVAMTHDGHGVAAGRWGVIFSTDDFGATWTPHWEIFSPDLAAVAFDGAGTGCAVGADGQALITADSGKTWRHAWTGTTRNLTSVSSAGPGIFIAVGIGGAAMRSVDGGVTWQPVSLPVRTNFHTVTFTDSIGFIGGDDGVLLRSHDRGAAWGLIPMDNSLVIRHLEFNDARHGWLLGGNGMIMETLDGGDSWIGQYTGVSCDFRDGWFGPDGYAVAVDGSGIVLESRSWGTNSSWTRHPVHSAWLAASPGMIFVSRADGSVVRLPSGRRVDYEDDRIRDFTRLPDITLVGVGDFGRIVHIVY